MKWLILDVSDLGNGRWYFFDITLALFSISLGLTLKLQENNARANVWGIQKASCVMSSAKKHGKTYAFVFFFSCTNFFLFLFLAGDLLTTMF